MVICFSAGFSYSVLMWPRFAVYLWIYNLKPRKKPTTVTRQLIKS